jgi:hypothetical protein
MEDDNVYYIHVKGYKHYLPSSVIIKRFLNSNLAKDIKDNHAEREKFTTYMMNRLNYNIAEKDTDEQEMDVIISKKMLEHMKSFFKEDKDSSSVTGNQHNDITTTKMNNGELLFKKNIKSKSFKKKQTRKNRTMKKI